MKKTAYLTGWMVVLALCACAPKEEPPTTNGTVIGRTEVEIDTRMITTRVGEAAVGDFMMDLLREEMNAQGKAVDIAIINAGAIRGGEVDAATFAFKTNEAKLGQLYPAGDLTDLDVQGWYPFHDDTALVTITGTQLKSILERGVMDLPPDLRNDKGGQLLQVSGLKYRADCAGQRQQLNADGSMVVTDGSRINLIQVGSKVIYDSAQSVDLLASTSVRVVGNSFIAAGLDGHLALKQGTNPETLKFDDYNFAQKLVAKVKASSPIAPVKDGRIAIVGNCGQPLTQP